MNTKLEKLVAKSIHGRALKEANLVNAPEMSEYRSEIICPSDEKCFHSEEEIDEMFTLMREQSDALEF